MAKRGQVILLDRGALEAARIRKGLLFCELAVRAKVSKGSLYRAMQRGQAGLRVARRIAEALELNMGDIWLNVPWIRKA